MRWTVFRNSSLSKNSLAILTASFEHRLMVFLRELADSLIPSRCPEAMSFAYKNAKTFLVGGFIGINFLFANVKQQINHKNTSQNIKPQNFSCSQTDNGIKKSAQKKRTRKKKKEKTKYWKTKYVLTVAMGEIWN